MKIYKICLLLIFVLSFSIKAQTNKIAECKRNILESKSDITRLEAILKLLLESPSMHTDTFSAYINRAKILNSIVKDEKSMYKLKIFEIASFAKKNQMKMASLLLENLEDSLPKTYINTTIQADIYNTKGSLLVRQGLQKEAITTFYLLIALGEKLKNEEYILKGMSGITWTFFEMSKYKDCIAWARKVQAKNVSKKNKKFQLSSYLNLSSSYNNLFNYDSAMYYVNYTIKFSKEIENLTIECNALNIRSDIYLNLHDIPNAQKDLQEALEIRKSTGDLFFIIADYAQLGVFYSEYGDSKKGIETVKEALDLVEKNKIYARKIYVLELLSHCYFKDNDMKNYANTLNDLMHEKDEMYKRNTVEEIVALNSKYELQKKENTIIQQKLALVQSHYLLFGSLILFLLFAILSYFFYKNYQYKQNNKLHALVNEEKLNSQREIFIAKETERKRIASDLHDSIGIYASAIISNVHYLKSGQLDLEQSTQQLEDNANQIVNELGNTVWVLKNEHLLLTALSDKLKIWINRLCVNFPDIEYHFSEEIINEITFTPYQSLQLLHVIQESIHNALKHSKCKNIYMVISSDLEWNIKIMDDGIGFNQVENLNGNGLLQIKSRMESCGWYVVIRNNIPQGTLIHFSNKLL